MADDPFAPMLQQHLSGATATGTAAASPPSGPPPPEAPDPFAPLIQRATTSPDLPPGQMTGWQREVALPASGFAHGIVSTFGVPGDVVRGVGYIGGRSAEQYLNPDPLTVARNQLMVTPEQGPRIVTPQNLAESPDKPNVPAPSLHNPVDTESLLGYTAPITNRPDLQPQNFRERVEAAGAQGVGSAVPMLFTGGGSSVAAGLRTLFQGAAGGAGGEVGGEVGEKIAGAPGQVAGTVLGGVLGGSLSPGGGGPVGTVRRGQQALAAAGLPSGLDADTMALAQRAKDLGINVGVGSASDSPFVRYVDTTARKFPFAGYGSYDKANQEAFVRGVTNTFGESSPKLTSDVLNRAYDRIAAVFNNMAGRYNVRLDGTMDMQLNDISRKVTEAAIDQGQKNGIQTQIDKIRQLAAANNGVIPGKAYVDLTKKGESLDLLQGSRSTTSGQLGGQIRDTLDHALERSAAPGDVAALREARTQYKALKTVEPLSMRADAPGGITPSTGEVSPAALLGRVNQQYDNAPRAALGELPLKDLARIGQRFLKDPAQTGTGAQIGVMKVGEALAALAAGSHFGGGPEVSQTWPYIVAGLAAPRVAGTALRTPAIQDWRPAINSLMGVAPQILPGVPRNQAMPSD